MPRPRQLPRQDDAGESGEPHRSRSDPGPSTVVLRVCDDIASGQYPRRIGSPSRGAGSTGGAGLGNGVGD
jgi:hypothetical protein